MIANLAIGVAQLLNEHVGDRELQRSVQLPRIQKPTAQARSDVDVRAEGREEVNDVRSISLLFGIGIEVEERSLYAGGQLFGLAPALVAARAVKTPSINSAVFGRPSAFESPAPAK